MKRISTALKIVILLLIVALAGMLLFKFLVLDQVIDEGDMRNPNYLISSDNAQLYESAEEETTK